MSKIPSVVLKNGTKMPAFALGTYNNLTNCADSIGRALSMGYVHLDTAHAYQNEAWIGDAIQKVNRSDVFLTTKLDSCDNRPGDVVKALKTSLSKLKTEYVDLYLIHAPWTNDKAGAIENVDLLEVWYEMEECVELGLAKCVGVSNFNEAQVERLVKQCKKHQPLVNQIECHPWFNQDQVIEHHKALGVHVSAYCPIGRGTRIVDPSRPGMELLQDPVITALAEKHSTTPAHICIIFQIQRGASAIVKAASEANQRTNLDAFNTEVVLSSEDLAQLSALPQHRSLPFETKKQSSNYPF